MFDYDACVFWIENEINKMKVDKEKLEVEISMLKLSSYLIIPFRHIA